MSSDEEGEESDEENQHHAASDDDEGVAVKPRSSKSVRKRATPIVKKRGRARLEVEYEVPEVSSNVKVTS